MLWRALEIWTYLPLWEQSDTFQEPVATTYCLRLRPKHSMPHTWSENVCKSYIVGCNFTPMSCGLDIRSTFAVKALRIKSNGIVKCAEWGFYDRATCIASVALPATFKTECTWGSVLKYKEWGIYLLQSHCVDYCILKKCVSSKMIYREYSYCMYLGGDVNLAMICFILSVLSCFDQQWHWQVMCCHGMHSYLAPREKQVMICDL